MTHHPKSIELLVRDAIGGALARDPDKLQATDRLDEDLNCDSLDRLEISMYVEEEIQIEITDDEGAACKTVQDVIDLVRAKVNADIDRTAKEA